MPDLKRPKTDLNLVVVTGTLTRDPELSYVNTDTAMCKGSIANKESYKDKNGEWQEKTSFFEFTVFGKYAEIVHKQCAKGNLVQIQGQLQQETWKNKEGENRSKVSIRVPFGGKVESLQWNNDRVKDGAYRDPDAGGDHDPDVGDQDDIPF